MKRFSPLPAALLILLCAALTGCGQKEPISRTGLFFDTVVSVTVYDHGSEELLDGCMELCKYYEQLFSPHIPESDIARINRAGGKPVAVSEDTARLLRTALRYCEMSDGGFDITIAPLSGLWDFKNRTGVIPPQDEIDEALRHVDYRGLILDGNTARLEDKDAALDLGGAAKGYIADRLKEYLLTNKVNSALIDLGGNILAVGGKPDGSDFRIGVQMPFEERNTVVASVLARDVSVVSSGVYERYFMDKEKLYHHILDKKTGYPFENNLLGVTVLTESSAEGDCLSTVCYTLGLEKGLKLVEELSGTEALFITKDYKLHPSSGFPLQSR